MHRKRTLQIIAAVVGIVGVFFVISFAIVPWLSSEAVQRTIESLGPWGPAALIGYTILAHIIAPLAGSVGFVVGVSAFGLPKTVLYIYIGSMVSAVINFFLSRQFGRPLVRRLVGRRTMEKIDEMVDIAGVGALTILRLFGVAVFEEISYAAGLTNMRFRAFMIITILASIPPHLAIAFIFTNTDFSVGGNIALLLIVLSILGVASTSLVHMLLKKKRGVQPIEGLEKSTTLCQEHRV